MGFPKKISQLPLANSLAPTDLFVRVGDKDVTTKVSLSTLQQYITSTDTYVTGGTFNTITENIDFVGTTLFPPFSVNLSAITDTNTFVTGATLNTTILDLDRNDNVTISVDLASLSGTNTFVTGFTYDSSNNTFSITNNDNDIFSAYIDAVSGLTINDYTLPLSDGEEYQVVRTDGNGNLIFDWADRAYLEVRVGESMTKGDPVYVSGFNLGQNRIEVEKADASDPNKMPSIGLVVEDVVINQNTQVATVGVLDNVNTQLPPNDFNEGDVLYVNSGGGLTNIKPTGTNLIQNVGKVGRRNQINGEIIVFAIGRSNDVPNILNNYIWLGNSSGVATPTDFDSLVSGFTTGNTLQEVIENGSTYSGPDIVQINTPNGFIVTSNVMSTVSAFGVTTSGTTIRYEDSSNDKREISLQNNEFIVTDEIGSKGLEYAGDYSSNFTNESLITKKYVDSTISGKVDTTLFDSYTADTQTEINSKLDITTFDDYTANTKDNVVTGATLNGNLLELERNNGLSDVTVDLSSLTATTPTIDEVIAAGNQLTNTNSTLDLPLGGSIGWNTIGGEQRFSVSNNSAAQTYIRLVNRGGELEMDDSMISLSSFAGKDLELKTGGNTDDFRIYLGTNGPSVGDVLEVKSLDGNTGLMGWATLPSDFFVSSGNANAATQQLTFTNTTGGTFNVTNGAALFSDNDVNVTGGTYDNNTGCVTFTTNSGTSFDVCGFITGLTDTYTSSGTYNNNTAEITFTRTDASTYTVDLSTLDLNDTYVTGGTVSVPATNNDNSGNIGLFYKNSDGIPRVLPFEDTFTTGTTFDSGTNILSFDKNDGSSYSTDLSSLSGANTFVTGGTVSTSANTLTLNYNNGSTVTPISGINDLPICRIAITGNTGLSNTNNSVDFLALYNGEVYNTDPTEFIRQNSKIQIVNSGRYMIRARYSSYDMVGGNNFLRLAAITASTSSNGDLGTKLEYLDQGFIGTTGNGEASKMGSTIYNASGGEWIGVVVLHGGATGGSGSQGYPVFDNSLFNQPYLEIIKIGT